jgi:hypothetical protein
MNWFVKAMKALNRGIGELSPSCRQASRLQSDALDRQLTLRQRMGLRIHLWLCKWCRRYGKQISFLRVAAHEHDKEDVSVSTPVLSAEARERIQRRLQSETKQPRL